MNKKLYIFFSLTSFAYMLSVSVYLLNSFIMLNDTIFAVHAGISPLLKKVEEINALNRFQEIPLISLLFVDLLS